MTDPVRELIDLKDLLATYYGSTGDALRAIKMYSRSGETARETAIRLADVLTSPRPSWLHDGSVRPPPAPYDVRLARALAGEVQTSALGTLRGAFDAFRPWRGGHLRAYACPSDVMRAATASVQGHVESRRLLGQFGPVEDGRARISDSLLVVTRLELRGPSVFVEADVLDTEPGRAFMRAPEGWYLAPRGYGSIDSDGYLRGDFRITGVDLHPTPTTAERGVTVTARE